MKTEQIIEEREDSVKMKMRFKRFLSGFMAVATLASVIIQPVAVSASELEPEEIPFEQQYAELKDVQDSLDPDEIVKANDIELSYGQEFDVEVDLSGIEGVDESKIKILFHEAKNETGTDFDTHTPDTYKAVYAVEPVSGHPAYRISRNITVKEPETEVQSERSSDSTVNVDDDTGDTEQSEEDSESHRETQNAESTADLESELTVSEALEQAESNGIDRQKVEVMVTKQDEDTENPLAGGIFGLYAASDITNVDGTVIVKKGTLIQKETTGADGTAKFTADLPLGFSYDVKEVQAPKGYVRNTDDVYTFAFSYTNDKEAKQTFKHTFKNERVTAKISLQKQDKETKKAVPQGDATLEKAVYGLYAREDIVHPDGATGVIYKAGEQVATLTTDENGQASVDGLYLGNYYVKEITPPTGYLADEEEHDLVCNYEGDLVAEVKRDCLSLEQVMKQPFQIIKAANNGKTDADLLKGAGFTAYLASSLKVKEDGSYDFDSAKPVVIGENGATEIFTDEKGYACSIAIPYGTYIVRETTTPHNYTPVDDFTVRITENNPNQPQTWRVLLDDEFEAKLKIIKQDDETKKAVLQKNTEFKIFNMDTEKYVEQVTTYPTTVKHKSYFTDEQGYLILPQNLKIGHYRIEEVNAPYG